MAHSFTPNRNLQLGLLTCARAAPRTVRQELDCFVASLLAMTSLRAQRSNPGAPGKRSAPSNPFRSPTAHQTKAPANGRGLRQNPRSRGSVGCTLRPHRSLVAGLHHADALIVELLDALTLVGLSRIDVALGIRRDRVHAEELAGLASAAAERGQFLHAGA